MHDNDRAVDDNPTGPTMLGSLMTAAAAYAVRRGIALEEIARVAGLEPHTLVATADRVPDDALSRILGLLDDRFPGEAVSLDMALAAPVQFLGPLEQAARHVPDLRSGIQMFVDFQRVLSTSVTLELVETGPGPMLRFDHPNDRAFGSLGAEMALVMGVRAVAEVFGAPDALRAVWCGHAPLAPERRYHETFDVPVRFEAPSNALLFHGHRLSDPVDPGAGARLRVLRAQLELVRRELDERAEPEGLRVIRRAAAHNAGRGEFSAAALAAFLGMSPRTLQRRLGQYDTSASAVIEDVREATARQLLADPDLSLFEVSRTLGYSTESAFRRAFRRWTGDSPANHRRRSG